MKEFAKDHDFNALVYRHRALYGLIAGIIVLSSIIYTIGRGQRRNHEAILKSCILLNNKIIESQSAAGANVILVQEVLKLATEHGDKYVIIEYRKRIRGVPDSLEQIDCTHVAAHPERIKAIQSSQVIHITVPTYSGPH